MKTQVHDDPVVMMTAPSGGVVSGRGVLIGQLFGVSLDTVAAGTQFGMLTSGVVDIAKTSALAITAGDALYWDDTNKVVNKTSSSQKEVGYALADAANPSSTVQMLIQPTIRTSVAA